MLDRERRAALDGDVEALPGLLAEKERLVTDLEAHGAATGARLDRARAHIARNRALLDSALEGMRTAMRAIGARRQALNTYDMTGARTVIGQDAHRLHQRR
ncbi:flagellar biosynthesis protein FlgN [Sediminimonas sp.]|uniref:flagellar biosynthesis protein FlgN n=1 Tax=Sediminimonas sp. TaxID=2823379 RepID=UPI0025D3F85E|nr:flagellar biosynthesis protein FlgN [Sediminimonas sp.]